MVKHAAIRIRSAPDPSDSDLDPLLLERPSHLKSEGRRSSILAIEAQRVRAQVDLDAQRESGERRRLGQFATPAVLARQITRLALAYHHEGPIRFLEPSVGSGAFFSSLLMDCAPDKLVWALGFEVDPRFTNLASRLWGTNGLEVRRADFCQSRPELPMEAASLVLANPPYVRHHHIDAAQKTALRDGVFYHLGLKPSGLSGTYVYFMLLADRWLAPGATSAWLVPSEWMDVNYGSVLRDYLTSRVTLLRVHKFAALDSQFDDALVSSSVVFFSKSSPSGKHRIEWTQGACLTQPSNATRVQLADLRSASKWGTLCHGRSQRVDSIHTRLGDLMTIRRGIATGSNPFFVRPRQQFHDLGIPDHLLRPVLPSSRHLHEDVIRGDSDGYPLVDPCLALLDTRMSLEELATTAPELWRYLRSDTAKAVASGYLTQRRHPWYSQEQRPHAPFVCTYMGRGGRQTKPLRFLWNRSRATATNTFLMLIPKSPLAGAMAIDPRLEQDIFHFLRDMDIGKVLSNGRVYGGGLHKIEPMELARVDVSPLAVSLHHKGFPAIPTGEASKDLVP